RVTLGREFLSARHGLQRTLPCFSRQAFFPARVELLQARWSRPDELQSQGGEPGHLSSMSDAAKSNKDPLRSTLNLPKTSFSMKANLLQMEPTFQKRWEKLNLYQR